MKATFETERLYLRDWHLSDVERLFEICRQASVMKYIGAGEPHKSLAEAENFLKWAQNHQRERGFCRLAVVEKASGKIIGSCGLARLPKTSEIELGYLFDEKFWGRGFASEAARECLKFGFEHLSFREIIALTNLENTASQNVLTKIGFTERGVEIYDGKKTLVYSIKNT